MTMKPVKKELGCFIVRRRGVSSPSSISHPKKKHLDRGKHEYALEKETLYNKTMTLYAAELAHGAGAVPETVDEDVSMSLENEGSALPMGWALKSATVTRKNVTGSQKNYLIEVFQE